MERSSFECSAAPEVGSSAAGGRRSLGKADLLSHASAVPARRERYGRAQTGPAGRCKKSEKPIAAALWVAPRGRDARWVSLALSRQMPSQRILHVRGYASRALFGRT